MRTLAVAAFMAAVAGGAQATEGWYGRVDVGSSIDGSLDGSVSDGIISEPFSPDLEEEWMGGVGLGYAMRNGFRLEGELSYRQNDWEPTALPAFGTGASGDATSLALMGNLLYDFNRDGRLQPYLGVGVGAARVNIGIDAAQESEDTTVAYQGMAGISYAATERLTFDLGYRYFMAPDVDASEAFSSIGIANADASVDYEHQAVTVGMRWQFASYAAPPASVPVQAYQPPAPTPAPAPVAVCSASEFVVYFEWDQSDLNQAALETIETAANRARACNVSAAVVVGHTDSSGSGAYNAVLSERRASVVRDALTSRGMSASTIRTEARGENDLARATRDGVREPLNRRTAVTISFR
jgi:OOP family OmpA-OmpF porin